MSVPTYIQYAQAATPSTVTTPPTQTPTPSTTWWPTAIASLIIIIGLIIIIVWSSNRGTIEDQLPGDDLFDPDEFVNVEAFELKSNGGWSEGVQEGPCVIFESDPVTGKLTNKEVTGVCYNEPFERAVMETSHVCEEPQCVSMYTGEIFLEGETETYRGPCLNPTDIKNSCPGQLCRWMFTEVPNISGRRCVSNFTAGLRATNACTINERSTFRIETRQTAFARITLEEGGECLLPSTDDERMMVGSCSNALNSGFTWLLIPSRLFEGDVYPQCIAFWTSDTDLPPPSFSEIFSANPFVISLDTQGYLVMNKRFRDREISSTTRFAYYRGFELYLDSPINVDESSPNPVVPFFGAGF